MRATATVLLTAVLLALALIVSAPSALLGPRLAEASAGVVTLVESEGSLWHGRATLAMSDSRLPFAWSVDAADLLRGRLTLRVSPQDAVGTMPAAAVTARRDGILLSDIDVIVPAHAASAALASAKGIALGGDLSLSIKRLEARSGSLSGQAVIVWRRARAVVAAGGPVREFGDVTVTLAGDDGRLAGPMTNEGGLVAIRGDVALNLRGVIAATALVTPRSADDGELAGLLAAVGKPESGGWRIDWRNGAP
jgi:general secretion pathway protein N